VGRLAARHGLLALALAVGNAAAAPDARWHCAAMGGPVLSPALAVAAGDYLDRVEARYPHQVLGLVRAGDRFYLLNASDVEWGERARLRLLALRLNESYLTAERRAAGAAPGSPPPGDFICLAAARARRAGLARTPRGEVELAAGQRLHLVDPQEPQITVEVRAADDRSLALGELFRRSARTGIYAGLTGPLGKAATYAAGAVPADRVGGVPVFKMASAGGVRETRINAPEAIPPGRKALAAAASGVAPAAVAARPQAPTAEKVAEPAPRQEDSIRGEPLATVSPEPPSTIQSGSAAPTPAPEPAAAAIAAAATDSPQVEGAQSREAYAKIMKTMMALRRSGGVRSVSEMTYVHPAVERIRRPIP